MPPTSKTLFDEGKLSGSQWKESLYLIGRLFSAAGAQIVSFKVVKKGVLDYDNLKRLLVDEPAKYPGSSGCRESCLTL